MAPRDRSSGRFILPTHGDYILGAWRNAPTCRLPKITRANPRRRAGHLRLLLQQPRRRPPARCRTISSTRCSCGCRPSHSSGSAASAAPGTTSSPPTPSGSSTCSCRSRRPGPPRSSSSCLWRSGTPTLTLWGRCAAIARRSPARGPAAASSSSAALAP